MDALGLGPVGSMSSGGTPVYKFMKVVFATHSAIRLAGSTSYDAYDNVNGPYSAYTTSYLNVTLPTNWKLMVAQCWASTSYGYTGDGNHENTYHEFSNLMYVHNVLSDLGSGNFNNSSYCFWEWLPDMFNDKEKMNKIYTTEHIGESHISIWPQPMRLELRASAPNAKEGTWSTVKIFAWFYDYA